MYFVKKSLSKHFIIKKHLVWLPEKQKLDVFSALNEISEISCYKVGKKKKNKIKLSSTILNEMFEIF